MSRPIGVMVLAVLSVLVGLYELYLTAIYLGWVSFNVIGAEVSFKDPQWGQAILSFLLALIYFWVAAGFWAVRAWAWMYGVLISGWILIWSLFAVLGKSTLEAETVPIILSGAILLYLMYPKVRERFYESESARS